MNLGCIARALSKIACLLYALAPPDRIGEIDPAVFVFWFNLYEMTGDHCGHVPFLRRNIKVQRALLEPRFGSCPRARSLREPAPHHRAFQAQDSRSKQGRASAIHRSRDWRFLKENEEGLRGHPGYDQEGTSRDSQHHERAEMMIVRLSAQRSSFSHSRRLRRLAGISQPSRCLPDRTTEKFVRLQ